MGTMCRLEDMNLKQLGDTPHSDMDVQQRDKMITLCKQAFESYERCTEKGKEENEACLISKYFKAILDREYGPNWFVLVGQAYVAQFSHESKTYWHFYHRKNYITCYKAA